VLGVFDVPGSREKGLVSVAMGRLVVETSIFEAATYAPKAQEEKKSVA